MVTTYTVLKAVHVLAAVMWVGGNLALNVIGTRAANSGDGPRIVGFGRDAKWMGERLYLPASVIVLVFAS